MAPRLSKWVIGIQNALQDAFNRVIRGKKSGSDKIDLRESEDKMMDKRTQDKMKEVLLNSETKLGRKFDKAEREFDKAENALKEMASTNDKARNVHEQYQTAGDKEEFVRELESNLTMFPARTESEKQMAQQDREMIKLLKSMNASERKMEPRGKKEDRTNDNFLGSETKLGRKFDKAEREFNDAENALKQMARTNDKARDVHEQYQKADDKEEFVRALESKSKKQMDQQDQRMIRLLKSMNASERKMDDIAEKAIDHSYAKQQTKIKQTKIKQTKIKQTKIKQTEIKGDDKAKLPSTDKEIENTAILSPEDQLKKTIEGLEDSLGKAKTDEQKGYLKSLIERKQTKLSELQKQSQETARSNQATDVVDSTLPPPPPEPKGYVTPEKSNAEIAAENREQKRNINREKQQSQETERAVQKMETSMSQGQQPSSPSNIDELASMIPPPSRSPPVSKAPSLESIPEEETRKQRNNRRANELTDHQPSSDDLRRARSGSVDSAYGSQSPSPTSTAPSTPETERKSGNNVMDALNEKTTSAGDSNTPYPPQTGTRLQNSERSIG